MNDNDRSTAPGEVVDGTVAHSSGDTSASASADSQVTNAQSFDPDVEGLDDLDSVDFDLDEVENKIAPLALASNEAILWRP
ncbi:hypothetical protein FB564_3132 [Salinispora arenicola]|nr:hypothetical protein FB564_3132 [Salinispora arenicola]